MSCSHRIQEPEVECRRKPSPPSSFTRLNFGLGCGWLPESAREPGLPVRTGTEFKLNLPVNRSMVGPVAAAAFRVKLGVLVV